MEHSVKNPHTLIMLYEYINMFVRSKCQSTELLRASGSA